MPRPCCLRHIDINPSVVYFKPAGIPVRILEEVVLTLDELESLRLADFIGLYQEQAAEQMKISRPTFSRVVEQARRKVADALIHGKALRLEGGAVVMKKEKKMPRKDEKIKHRKIAIPVASYSGFESAVFGHFGSAPSFALVDAETMSVKEISNSDHDHVHGACNPMRALAGAHPDAIIVGGIGMGALMGLREAGIKVFRAAGGTVADAVRQLNAAELQEIEENGACTGHGGGHSCHHTGTK